MPRQLKADSAPLLSILFMTGFTDTEHMAAAFSAGSADYVTKPIRPVDSGGDVAIAAAGVGE